MLISMKQTALIKTERMSNLATILYLNVKKVNEIKSNDFISIEIG